VPKKRGASPWAPLRFPALVAAGVLLYGVLGYLWVFGWSFIDALYMTVMTMTTVGYTEVRALDTAAKLFTVTLLVLGATVLILTLSIAASVLLEDPVRERIRRRRLRKRVEDLDNHYIVCGYGRVGRTVAEELRREGVEFLIVDRSEELEHELVSDEVLYLIGDATKKEDLIAAGFERARALITAVDDDAENIFITMVARSLAPKAWIVSRASEEASIDRLKTAGANRVYSPFVTAGREMATAAISPVVVDFLEVPADGQPSLRLEELQIEAGSPLDGRRLQDIRGTAQPLAIRHADGRVVVSPADDVTLEPGDVLVLLGDREALRPLEQL
jgi:voltage-gated potassium channel